MQRALGGVDADHELVGDLPVRGGRGVGRRGEGPTQRDEDALLRGESSAAGTAGRRGWAPTTRRLRQQERDERAADRHDVAVAQRSPPLDPPAVDVGTVRERPSSASTQSSADALGAVQARVGIETSGTSRFTAPVVAARARRDRGSPGGHRRRDTRGTASRARRGSARGSPARRGHVRVQRRELTGPARGGVQAGPTWRARSQPLAMGARARCDGRSRRPEAARLRHAIPSAPSSRAGSRFTPPRSASRWRWPSSGCTAPPCRRRPRSRGAAGRIGPRSPRRSTMRYLRVADHVERLLDSRWSGPGAAQARPHRDGGRRQPAASAVAAQRGHRPGTQRPSGAQHRPLARRLPMDRARPQGQPPSRRTSPAGWRRPAAGSSIW